ncbi:MAG: hypothetical protein HZA22_13200 [Nitrospirae bacterium]|nr:hypothetical protein [Nitrospirota bacterium]
MYDLHAHILPGADDGPKEWDKAVKMLLRAAEDGITGIVATPHVSAGLWDNPKDKVASLVDELKQHAGAVPIEIYTGSEIHISPETVKGLKNGRYCTINRSRYVLVELPLHFTPDGMYDVIFSIVSGGFFPIIAHPERNPMVQQDAGVMYEMVRLGALGQVTAGSLTGTFGGEVKKLARELVTRKLVHVIASDAHNNGPRPPVLSHAYHDAVKLVGDKAARVMVYDVPEMIIENLRFEPEEPEPPKKGALSFLGKWVGL